MRLELEIRIEVRFKVRAEIPSSVPQLPLLLTSRTDEPSEESSDEMHRGCDAKVRGASSTPSPSPSPSPSSSNRPSSAPSSPTPLSSSFSSVPRVERAGSAGAPAEPASVVTSTVIGFSNADTDTAGVTPSVAAAIEGPTGPTGPSISLKTLRLFAPAGTPPSTELPKTLAILRLSSSSTTLYPLRDFSRQFPCAASRFPTRVIAAGLIVY